MDIAEAMKTIRKAEQGKNSDVMRSFARIIAACMCTGLLISCTSISMVSKQTPKARYQELMKTGTDLTQQRYHTRALRVFKEAGRLCPERPEWEYETAAALFNMDRFKEAANIAGRLVKRSPDYDHAYGLWWMARLAESKKNPAVKAAVRREIKTLLDDSGRRRPQALFSAYIAYDFLDDRPQQQQTIEALARLLPLSDPDLEEAVRRDLLEEIIREKSDSKTRLRLMGSFLSHFPRRPFAGYAAYQWLAEKQRSSDIPVDPIKLIRRFNPPQTGSREIQTGTARWLMDQQRLLKTAVDLLEKSLGPHPPTDDAKPPGFDDALWQAQLQHQTNERYALLGRAWFMLGQYDRAAAALSRAAAERESRGETWFYLGRIAQIQNDPDRAIAYYRRALEIGCSDVDPLSFLCGLMKTEYGFDGDPALYFAAAGGEIAFTDVTAAAGLSGQSAQHVSWGDYDKDGLPDLLLDGHRLFRNTGVGTFENVTDAAVLSHVTADGGIFGDYDNDGDLDLFIFSRDRNSLLQNRDQVFVPVRQDVFGAREMHTAAAAWGDLNNDGCLDLYVANYENFAVMRGAGIQDRLYLNDGAGGFTDISRQAGIETDEAMCGRGVVWTDYNENGWLDIVVANYRLDPNFLWMNRGGLNLADQAGPMGVRGHMKEGFFGHSIGPVSGDLDNDGDPDLFITNLAHPRYIEISDPNMLLINRGAPDYAFVDRYGTSGIRFEETNADPALADVDNDGDLDLYITSVYPGRRSHLYANQLDHHFTDITWVSGTRVENSWGCAFADFNDDGFADLITAGKDGVHLFQNNGNGRHWIKVKIDDAACNRYGIGGRVTLILPGGRQVREITAGRGTGDQDGVAVLFGLGDYRGPGRVDYRSLCGDVLTAAFDHPDQTILMRR